MSTFVFGDQTIKVDPVNESAFEAAGWARVDEPKKKSRKSLDAGLVEPVDPVGSIEAESPADEAPEE